MKSPQHVLICAGLLAAVFLTVAAAQDTDLTRITRVIQQPQPARTGSSFVNTLSPRRLPKFVSDISAGTVRFDVEWLASSAGVPSGAAVVLEYRLGKSLQNRSVSSRIDGLAKGRQVTTFYVQLPAGEVAGKELAWRARIVRARQVLAERQSTLWR
ncbi:MAG: hypothetical protein V1929_14050 [bacterium]